MANKLFKKNKPEIIHTVESEIRHPWRLLGEMLGDVIASRELAWRLLVRNIKAQYRQSFLGIFWALIPPALTAIGCTFASNAGIINIGNTDIPYPAYVMLGTTLWQTFLDAFNGPGIAFKSSRSLLTQIKFPHEAIIISQLGQTFFNLLVKLIFVVLIFLVFQVPVSWMIIFSPFTFLSLILLGTAIGLLLIPVTNLIKDVANSLQVVILVWFFITPVAFPVPNEGIMSIMVKLNPVTPLLVTARELVTTGEISYSVAFVLVSLLSLLMLLIGWLVFRLSMPFLIERVS